VVRICWIMLAALCCAWSARLARPSFAQMTPEGLPWRALLETRSLRKRRRPGVVWPAATEIDPRRKLHRRLRSRLRCGAAGGPGKPGWPGIRISGYSRLPWDSGLMAAELAWEWGWLVGSAGNCRDSGSGDRGCWPDLHRLTLTRPLIRRRIAHRRRLARPAPVAARSACPSDDAVAGPPQRHVQWIRRLRIGIVGIVRTGCDELELA
jgi:hypothetical protein